MIETQWPRFHVFKQDTEDDAHVAVGTVHAPDPDIALLNARDVFARRPACFSLWVAPAEEVFSKTVDDTELISFEEPEAEGQSDSLRLHVFQKGVREVDLIHVGTLLASSPLRALREAQLQFPSDGAALWWIVPDHALSKSDPGESPSWFEPAHNKPYRQPSFYRTHTQMREVRRRIEDEGSA